MHKTTTDVESNIDSSVNDVYEDIDDMTAVKAVTIAQYQIQEPSLDQAVFALSWWLVIDTILFGLLLAAVTVPAFAFQTIPSGCNSNNSITSPPLRTKLYYNRWQGVGTTPECKQTDTDYCIKWSNNKAWSYMDSITDAHMQYDIHAIQISQSMLCVTVAIAFFRMLYRMGLLLEILTSEKEKPHLEATVVSAPGGPESLPVRPVPVTFYTTGVWLFLRWIFAAISLSLFLYTDQMIESYWQTLWTSGYSIPNILHQTGPSRTSITAGSCTPMIHLSDGAILLGTACSIAFVASITIWCISCWRLAHFRAMIV